MTPKEFIFYRRTLQREIERIEEDIEEAYQDALVCPLPSSLRAALPSDIVVGNVIWYKDSEPPCWCAVEEVLIPTDQWKGYVWDGARYGLNGAFVEDGATIN